ncbi:hypothetical protein Ancab_038919 [Ancistrocladus abbreviatus]
MAVFDLFQPAVLLQMVTGDGWMVLYDYPVACVPDDDDVIAKSNGKTDSISSGLLGNLGMKALKVLIYLLFFYVPNKDKKDMVDLMTVE